MVVVENVLCEDEVLLDLRLLVPGDRQQPIEIVADDRRLGGHRRHLAQLLQLVLRLFARLLRQLGFLDLLLDLLQLVAPLLVAELLLDRLHLLVEVVFALRLLHLPLDAGADALFHLEDGNLALHQAEHLLQPLGHDGGFEDRLLVRNLDRQVRCDGVGHLGVVLDLLDDADDLGRDLLVELHIALELGHDRACERFRLHLFTHGVGERNGFRLVIVRAFGVFDDARALSALDQHFDRAVGQLEQLQHARERAHLVDRVGGGIVIGGVLLRGEQNERVGSHDLFERADGLLAADEERHDHVREHHDVAQRQHRVGPHLARLGQRSWPRSRCHGPILIAGAPPPRPAERAIAAECKEPGREREARWRSLQSLGHAARRRDPARKLFGTPNSTLYVRRLIGGDPYGTCQEQLAPRSRRLRLDTDDSRGRQLLSVAHALAPASPARSA